MTSSLDWLTFVVVFIFQTNNLLVEALLAMDIVTPMCINVYKKVAIPSARELFEMYGESRSNGNYTATMDSEDVPVVSGFKTKLEQVASGSQILRAEVAREEQRVRDALARQNAAANPPQNAPETITT